MMNEIQKQLDGIVDSYYDELMSTDITDVKDHKYSDKYNRRIEEAFAVFEESNQPKPHRLRRKIIIALVAAALIGTITVAAYEPARRFFMNLFSDHTEVTPDDGSLEMDTHKAFIEKDYSVTVPNGFVLDKDNLVETDTFVIKTYYNKTTSKTLMFEQMVKSSYKANYDNKQYEFVTQLDKNGQEIMIHSNGKSSVSIIWDNGEYIFELYGDMSKEELLQIYYTVQ